MTLFACTPELCAHLLEKTGQWGEDAQCLGLTEADDPQAFASKEACSHMAYKRKMMTLEELSRAEVIRAITQVIRAARWALDVRHGTGERPRVAG